jgi:hypothetical protein
VDRAVAATEHPGYLPGSTAGTVYVCSDPNTLYEVQEDNVSADLALTAIGSNCNHVAGVGSTTTGRSAHVLDSDSTGTTGGFRVIGLVAREDNAVGTAAKWIVKMNENTFAEVTGI